jgi:hypothetical protein
VRFVAIAILALGAAACSAPGGTAQTGAATVAACPPAARPPFALPTVKGINYGQPAAADGQYLGSSWLRTGTESQPGWESAKPRLQADLDFIAAHRLGQVVRLFVGLDQLMVWDRTTGFVRYDAAALDHLTEALDMFDAHHVRVLAVLFDQEETSSPGNFRFQALDGAHPAMRAGYLKALDAFLRRFGSRPTVAGWDLFNEAYNSLGREGGLSRPPAGDPVSPNYPDAVVQSWIRDLYRTARCAAPRAWFTVSDTTELYWKTPPDTARYDGAADFYDIHVYDDHPAARDWRQSLHLPYVLGEVGGDVGHGLQDQSVNSRVVGFWLAQAGPLGITGVLAHAGGGAVYSLAGGTLTPTGQVVAAAP